MKLHPEASPRRAASGAAGTPLLGVEGTLLGRPREVSADTDTLSRNLPSENNWKNKSIYYQVACDGKN